MEQSLDSFSKGIETTTIKWVLTMLKTQPIQEAIKELELRRAELNTALNEVEA